MTFPLHLTVSAIPCSPVLIRYRLLSSGLGLAALLGLAFAYVACGEGDGAAPSPTVSGAIETSTAPATAEAPVPTAPSGLPTRRVVVESASGSTPVVAEIASTREQRGLGLMFRQSLPEDTGMLFVYGTPPSSGHWMRNTFVALDIAYIDATGAVNEVLPGKPLDETVQRPTKPYLYVLEMPLGWFAAHGHTRDVRLSLPADLPRGEQ